MGSTPGIWISETWSRLLPMTVISPPRYTGLGENALKASLSLLYWSVLISSCLQPVSARMAATAIAENLNILFMTFFI